MLNFSIYLKIIVIFSFKFYLAKLTYIFFFWSSLMAQQYIIHLQGRKCSRRRPGLGRSPGGGHGNPLQYSCLENLMDRGAWRATVQRVTKSQTRLKSWAHVHIYLFPGLSPCGVSADWLWPLRSRTQLLSTQICLHFLVLSGIEGWSALVFLYPVLPL